MKAILRSNIGKLKFYLKQSRRKKLAVDYYRDHERNHPGNYYSTNCFDYYQCIFIHIPKTAGLSVCKALFGNYAGGHQTYDFFVKKFGAQTVNRYFKFTFVRNPWDRLASAYFFLKKGGINEADAAFAEKYLSGIDSFESFVNDWLTDDKLDLYYHLVPQYKFVTSHDDPNNVMVDFTGRFENLQEDFKIICDTIKISDRALLNVNVTSEFKIKYKELYTAEMKDKVAMLYAMDIKLFEYSFE